MIWKHIREMIRRKALFVINHSGGKDSQAMYLRMRRIVPFDQLIIVYAELGEVEWDGTEEHINKTTSGEPLYIVSANKRLLDMVEARGKFPSPQYRQCTSDLKRGPIEKCIRHIAKTKGQRLIVNCMGMRAAESPNRSKLKTFKLNKSNSVAGREWYDLLPIHHMSTQEVFNTIAAAGQTPHWVYAAGMTRKSCAFCIMASKADLTTAARLRPELYRKYVLLERKINYSMSMGQKFLPEITGIAI